MEFLICWFSANSLMVFTWIFGLLFVFLFYLIKQPRNRTTFQKPFVHDARRPLEALECDPKQRALRLEQHFCVSKLPDKIDAIVIGSGVGGLATAAILAKSGRKVVVLEKITRAGGCSGSFNENGYEWDIGIHYVGRMGPEHFERFLLDQLTEGQLAWQQLDEDFDNVVLVKSPDQVDTIKLWGDRSRLLNDLIRRYPKHEAGLRKFFALIPASTRAFMSFAYLKIMPIWLAKLITKLRLYKLFTSFFTNFHEVTVKSQLDKLFGAGETEIKTVLNYCFGLYNVQSHNAGVGILAFAYDYYDRSAYYPIGGASEIAYSLIPTIEKAGGRVLVNANVTEILLSQDNRRAVGVRVDAGSGQVDIKAPIVISDVGVSNTFRRLLPTVVAKQTKVGQLLESGRIHPGMAGFQVFVGLKGSQAELGLPNKNLWLIYDTDFDDALSKWYSLDLETAVFSGKIPYVFVAFPSAKDPLFNDRLPGRSVCTVLTSLPFEWFRKWENEPVKYRSDDYKAAKMHLANRCWQLVVDLYPELADRMDFIDAASPLTMSHYINAYAGEPYGLDNDTERFAPDVAIALQPKVPEIDNLYMTGQDILACGLVTCLYSSILTCQAIMRPQGECANLLEDATKLFNKNPSKKVIVKKEDSKMGNGHISK